MYFLLSILNKSYICHSINQRMDSLFIKQERLLAQTSTHIIRELMNQIHWDNPLIAIRGSRGVGKTTLMLQYIKLNFQPGSREVLYCTLDSIYFSNHTLSELIERFYLQGGKQLFLDEVHKYPTWSKEIKEAYDLYPSLRIVFSGSSLLNILNADADLPDVAYRIICTDFPSGNFSCSISKLIYLSIPYKRYWKIRETFAGK